MPGFATAEQDYVVPNDAQGVRSLPGLASQQRAKFVTQGPRRGEVLPKGLRRRRRLADVDFPAFGVSAAMCGDVDVVVVAVPRS